MLRKLTTGFVFLIATIPFAFLEGGLLKRSHAAVTEIVVLDPITGIAIFGYDPVAYFIDQEARIGQSQFEVTWKDAQWNFLNAANADRFRDAPAFYAPQFNGYGAMAMADGRATDGNPLIWAIYQNRLYFFYSAEARSKWVVNVAANVEAAKANWQKVSKNLSR